MLLLDRSTSLPKSIVLKCLCPLYYLCHNLQVSANTAALQRTDLTPKGKQRERSNQYQRAQRSVQIPKVYSLTGIWCRNWQLPLRNTKHIKGESCSFAQNRSQWRQLIIFLCMFSVVKCPNYKHKADKIVVFAVSNHCNIPKEKQWVHCNSCIVFKWIFFTFDVSLRPCKFTSLHN